MINQTIADAVISILKANDVDGETMEYIIEQTGMTDQMVKQLYHDKQDQGPEVDGAGFTDAPDREDIHTFTKEELITFSAKLIERTLDVVEEVITDTDISEDNDMVELELGYDNQITWTLNQKAIRNEIVDNVRSQIETDNDTIEPEVNNILSKIKESK
jgi:hypothetical protein